MAHTGNIAGAKFNSMTSHTAHARSRNGGRRKRRGGRY